jgi:hypothetical protein
VGRVEETTGETQGLVSPQRTEIDGCKWRSVTTRASGSVERVALGARSHYQETGAVSHCRGECGSLPEDLRIGPMEIFDNHQRWSSATSMRGERCCQRALSAMACGVIHGVVERTPFICLLQIEKVKSENKPLARYHPVRHQALGHVAPRFGFCRGRQAKQAQE